MIRYSDEMKPEDMQQLFSKSRLIRTEISTLIGLLLKNRMANAIAPAAKIMQQYLDQTDTLLNSLHQRSIAQPLRPTSILRKPQIKALIHSPSEMCFENQFFIVASLHTSFQYRDLSLRKYAKDDEWLRATKGFSIQSARDVVYAVKRVQEEKTVATLNAMMGKPREQWTILPGYVFTVQEIADRACIDVIPLTKC